MKDEKAFRAELKELMEKYDATLEIKTDDGKMYTLYCDKKHEPKEDPDHWVGILDASDGFYLSSRVPKDCHICQRSYRK